VQARDNKDAYVICPIVQDIGKPLQKLSPETRAHRRTSARERSDATDGGFDGGNKLLTKACTLVLVPVTGKR
jgi:hypothetical protein